MKVCPVCGKEYSDITTLCTADAAVLQSTRDPLVGQTLAGKYFVEVLIKRGGMGAVYRGKHVLMDKTVAIKVLRPSLAVDDDVVRRFSREAKAASRISHPHAVSVTDFGEAENGVVFLVMEYLDGSTLKEIIRAEGALKLDRVVEIIRQVTGALDAAHGQGVVHRDLKSDNIMLSQTNGGDWAKVLDFGIAKIQQPEGARDNDITAPNLVVGTPQYMSPEQCSQTRPIDARSDIYSLGVITYEMLAGSVPFTGESPTVIMMKQVQDPPPSLLTARPDLPASVGAVVARALAKEPENRFQTAGELCEALTKAAADATALIAPVTSAATVANAPISLPADDLDEETVVRPRQETPLYPPRAPAGTSAANFRPWRIMVPSLIALVAVFVIVFLLTRSPGQTPANQAGQTALTADPNGQAVQPTGSPTGAGERGIQPIAVATPDVSVNANSSPSQNSQAPSVTPNIDLGANANENSNPSAKPKPTATVAADDAAPPPRPSPTPKMSPKPSPKAAGTPPA